MALKYLCFHFLVAMVAVNLIFADEEPGSFSLPFFGGGRNNSGGFLGLPPFGSGQLPSFFGSRQERSADHHEEDEGEQQERLFFGNIVSCNYTTQGGTRCSSCRQSLACYPNNVGRLRTCRGLLRYCNNGRCSFTPGAECSSSSGNSTNSTR